MRPELKIVLLMVLVAIVFEMAPRVLPAPAVPNYFDSGETRFIQQNLSSPVLDWLMFVVYSFGYPFILFLAGGYLLWKGDVSRLAYYMCVLLIVHAFVLITWMVYPVAPPRLADDQVRDIRLSLGGFTESFNPYPSGAFPSLHVADTLVAVLFMQFHEGRKGKTLLASFFALISFSTLYLGEHYWFDIAGGILYACVGYALVNRFIVPRLHFEELDRRVTSWKRRKRGGRKVLKKL